MYNLAKLDHITNKTICMLQQYRHSKYLKVYKVDTCNGNHTMASNRNRTPKAPSVSEMANKLAQLELENRQLKKRIQNTTPGGTDGSIGRQSGILTAQQKEMLLVNAVTKLTELARQKIEVKLRAETAASVTRDEVESVLSNLNIRIHLSLDSACSNRGRTPTGGASKSRATSRGRGVFE
uniref:BLRF2 n=1 Tax=Otarine gammaherpesvirus 4 TaxID=2801541 RepID=A0A889IW61_9GAMA|nr:hypothetical protein [Otarine gammaherpesvirus 4]